MPELKAHGGDRKSEEENQADVCKVEKEQYGNKVEYRTRKLKRDHPDVFERMLDGEFENVAQTIEPMKKHGTNQHTERGDYNCNVLKRQGNSASYLIARIARDYPETLEDMKDGKFRSARQAAISVGLVKKDDRWSAPGPVEESVSAITKRTRKLSPTKRKQEGSWGNMVVIGRVMRLRIKVVIPILINKTEGPTTFSTE